MASFGSRSEVTISTMGAVHNPSGGGVAAVSSLARAKASKVAAKSAAAASGEGGALPLPIGDDGKREKKGKKNPFAVENAHKKQGGLGKGKWNTSGAVDAPAPLSKDDPMYDSEEDEQGVVLVSGGDVHQGVGSPPRHSYDTNLQRMVYGPKLTLAEYKRQLSTSLLELFTSSDIPEALRSISELDCAEYNYEVVKRAVSMSFDKGDREKELVSKLLSEAHPAVLSTDDVGKGFERVFENLEEYVLDAPAAYTLTASFLARAVVDELLPPSFLSDPLVRSLGGPVIEAAVQLLTREHSAVRLEKVWGVDGRPVAELKVAMDQLLKEYLLSRELDEALTCVLELNAPHFHHELIKRGVKTTLDSTDPDADASAMSALFKFLHSHDVLSSQQLSKGFNRCYSLLDDFKLDMPAAPDFLQRFVDAAVEDGIIASFTPPAAAGA
ncbi:hypothetical protein TeGR_g9113 [Tetraparma gracilis]|uniref:MI domain-containing protein n=1 Tax=Tetraparma gracilis TaxID=2962635 RepID=A0ABQ6MR50_9STRA|nr:hypothetical protein TeGR_g9113 [Tetraparma gracilis]